MRLAKQEERGKWVCADVAFPPQACSEPEHGFYAGEEMLVILRIARALVLWGLQSHLALSGNMYAVQLFLGWGVACVVYQLSIWPHHTAMTKAWEG